MIHPPYFFSEASGTIRIVNLAAKTSVERIVSCIVNSPSVQACIPLKSSNLSSRKLFSRIFFCLQNSIL
jgi:hypothetical protein